MIFLDFSLPNATTWFYFSLLLAVALFFKFSRFFSMRNWDVLTFYLLVPGLLLLKQAHQDGPVEPGKWHWLSYLWLLIGSGYFLVRCLLDLALVRRPALTPNLNLSGLAWLGGAMFACLASVAVRDREGFHETVGKESVPMDQMQRQVGYLIEQQTEASSTGRFNARAWGECSLAIVCHLAIVAGLILIGCQHFQDAKLGMAAATFYLLLPYTAFHFGQVHHVWPIALLIWALVAYRKPTVAGALLGLAAGSVYFPALLFPVWLSFYWRRGRGRFASAFILAAGLSLAVVGSILWLQGDLANSLRSALALSDWQPWKKPTTEGFWLWMDGAGVHWAYRIPVFMAFLAFVLTTVFWPAPKNLAHVLALSAAVLIGIQFWYADQGGVYVLWYLPLLVLLMFRPNLSDRRPPPINPETDWLARLGRALGRWLPRLLRLPEPLVRVQ
jgi:hypothetical protein